MRPPSFRTRILGVVVTVATVPLLVMGLWLNDQTARSGETLLADRLESDLREIGSGVSQRWIPHRSALLDLVETSEVREALDASSPSVPRSLNERATELDAAVVRIVIYDRWERRVWRIDRRDGASGSAFGTPLTTRLPIFDLDGRKLGTLEARVRFAALQPPTTATASAVVSGLDPQSGSVLLPVPFDPTLVGRRQFDWNGETWIGRTRDVAEPRVRLTAAAPLTPFAAPFEATARRGALFLLLIATAGVLAAVVLSSRLTSSLERLAEAANAISAGDLSRTVDVESHDEVGAVARGFNRMVESLQRTMQELAERESLAAVNEFAASMAHEVRNPLTSVQLDLQQVEEELPPDSRLRALQRSALDELRRLDRTVGDSLEAARSGLVTPRSIELEEPLRRALRRARPHVESNGASLREPDELDVRLVGDPDALSQLFLNLLLNAAEAVDVDDWIEVTVEPSLGYAEICVIDSGDGIPAADLERIFEPFFTTRQGGTGLGLAVARRIVSAHRGDIRIESRQGEGTTVRLRLPLAESSPG